MQGRITSGPHLYSGSNRLNTTQIPLTPTNILIIAGLCVGVIVLFMALPLLERFSLYFEAFSLLMEGIGEYINNPGLVRLGCLVIILMIVGCCIITIVGAGTAISCTTGNTAAICTLFKR